jgi:hypothetical protein
MKIKRYLLGIMMSFPVDIYPKVVLLDHMEVLFFIFKILSSFLLLFSVQNLSPGLCE